MFKIYSKKYPPGVVLLLSLLVLASILVVSLSVATLVFREFKTPTTSDQGIMAFYAAESGIEQGLYFFRQQNQDDIQLPPPVNTPQDLGNGATWTRTAATNQLDSIITNLPKDADIQFDLIDYIDLNGDGGAAPGSKMNINWNGDGSEWIEIGVTKKEDDVFKVSRTYWGHSASPLENISVDGVYKVRVRALVSSVLDLQITALDENNHGLLPEQIKMTAVGSLGDTKQTVVVSVPKHAPQSSVFDYTLFSECDITKGYGETACSMDTNSP